MKFAKISPSSLFKHKKKQCLSNTVIFWQLQIGVSESGLRLFTSIPKPFFGYFFPINSGYALDRFEMKIIHGNFNNVKKNQPKILNMFHKI